MDIGAHHPLRETLASAMKHDRRWRSSPSSPSTSSKAPLIMGFLSCLACLYVAGRLWQDSESRILLSALLHHNSDQRPKVLTVEDKLVNLGCKEIGRKIVEAEMDLSLAKSQAYMRKNETAAAPKLLAVVGVYTGFGSRLKRNTFRGSWMPRGDALRKLEERGVVIRFVIGRSANRGDSLDRNIDDENHRTKDFLILENHEEAVEELPRKAKFFFSTAVELQFSLLPHLTTLSLSHNSLSGVLPDDLGRLTSLRWLDLSANSFSGTISDNLFSTSLRFLDLSANRLSGPIPTTLPQCTLLLHLNLSHNSLSGNFITGLTSLIRLRVLDLSHNSISGPIPDSITNLRQLKILHLSNNAFSGAIPPNLGLCTHLNRLDLSGNFFNGHLPASIQFLTSLTFLSLSDNQLAGELPLWLGKLAALQYCDVSTNKLIGTVPDSFIGLTELTEIRLNHNGFNGSIPPTLFELGLQVVDLSSNNLTGEIPPGSTKLAETLEELDLSDNRLMGVIPPEVALYFKLRYLNLSWNELWTRVPPELGYFRDLSVLDLRRSGLNGAIPGELCDSGSIAVLQLDDNSLSGPIPEEIGNCSSLYLLSLSHNSLNSSIPIAMSRLKKLKILNLEYNKLTGEVPKQLGDLDSLLAVNISHNHLVGRLPNGGIFPSLDQSALQGNLGLCTPLVTEPCMLDVPKPLVLDPFAYGPGLRNTSNREPLVTEANPMSPQHRRFLSASSIVAISAALVIVFGVLVVSLVNVSVRRRAKFIENTMDSMCSSSAKLDPSPSAGKVVLFGPRSSFQSEDLAGGPESLLSKAGEIGRGTFGVMYKATIGNNRLVAIKKLLVSVAHSDFDRDVQILAKARHPNLMPLKGYYWTPHLQLLISDYAPNGSLHTLLHGSAKPLTWSNRFRIVSGTARGLAHLHQSRPPIVHYNVKPSNILVDEYFNPMVSDFGLAKLVPNQMISSRFHGAVGYMAPEMACQSLRVTEKCDVYGFGVVVLELVTGRRAVEYGEEDVVILIDQVRVLMEQGSAMDCVDPRMGQFPDEEVLPVLKLGMVCTSQIPSSRPSMTEVVQILQVIKTPVMD